MPTPPLSDAAPVDPLGVDAAGADPRLKGAMRAVIAHPFSGTLLMTGFPGLETGIDGQAVFTDAHCRETLEGLSAQGARTLFVLVERDELDPVAFEILERTAGELGVQISYHPIVDYGVPTDPFIQDWQAQRDNRAAHLRAGGTLAFSCQYGAGRSGLMVSWTLVEAGLSPTEAIAMVRDRFPEAVESDEQEAWLQSLAD